MATFMPTVDSVGDAALTNSLIDRSITKLKDDSIDTLGQHALSGCAALEVADFNSTVTFASDAFYGCSALTALILRNETKCTLTSPTGLDNTSVALGMGYIYVPYALLSEYVNDPCWGTYQSQIRAIEDYPIVCGDLGKVWTKTHTVSRDVTPFLAYGNQRFVACFSGDTLRSPIYSEDGVQWTNSTGSQMPCSALLYTGSVFVAGARNATGLYYSEDGKVWAQSNVTSGSVIALGVVNGVCIAHLADKTVWKSDDGKTWTQVCTAPESLYVFSYGNGVLVAGSIASGIWYSEDSGATWTQSNVTKDMYSNVEFGNGLFVAGGASGLHYSEDGKTWTKASNSNFGGFLLHSGGVWLASGNDGLWYSEDGKIWSRINSIDGYGTSAAAGDGIIVLSATGLYYSEDSGKTWTQSNNTSSRFRSIVYADGVFVAAEYSQGIWHSAT